MSDYAILDVNGKPLQQDYAGGGEVLPHVFTFGSILNQYSKTYSYKWDEALRHLPENAMAMRRDAYIRSLLQERALPTVNRSWNIKVEDKKDPYQAAVGKSVKACIERTPRWRRLIRYLLEAGWYGRYGSQLRWRQVVVGGCQRWVCGWHRPVNGDKIQFQWDGTPGIQINASEASRYPQDAILGTDRFPVLALNRSQWRQQFIIHSHEVDDADYYEGEMAGAVEGVGLRSQIYWAWWLRDEMLSWCVDFMRKVGTLGLLIFRYESGNKEAKAAAEANARTASQRVAITMPVVGGRDQSMTSGIEHIPANTGGVETLQDMIANYFERHMERLIVGQSMSSGGGGAGGLEGDGRANLAADTKWQLLKFDAENLAETLTTDLVRPLARMNFPDAKFDIKFEFVIESPENEKKMQAVANACSLGVTFRMDDVRELTGMEAPDEGDETVGGQPQPQTPDTGDGAPDDEPTPYAGDEKWITIGGHAEGDQKHVGGFAVQISSDGTILKGGPKGLRGKKVSEVHEHFKQEREGAVGPHQEKAGEVAQEAEKPKEEAKHAQKDTSDQTRDGFRESVTAKKVRGGWEFSTNTKTGIMRWTIHGINDEGRAFDRLWQEIEKQRHPNIEADKTSREYVSGARKDVDALKDRPDSGFDWSKAKAGDIMPSGMALIGRGITSKAKAEALAEQHGGRAMIDGPKSWAVEAPVKAEDLAAKHAPVAKASEAVNQPEVIKGRYEWDGQFVPDENGTKIAYKVGDTYHRSKAAAKAASKPKTPEPTSEQQQITDAAKRQADLDARYARTKSNMKAIEEHALNSIKSELKAAGFGAVAAKVKIKGIGNPKLPDDAPEEARAIRDAIVARYQGFDPYRMTPEEVSGKLNELSNRPESYQSDNPLTLYAFDANEPRDESGKWTSGGAGSNPANQDQHVEEIPDGPAEKINHATEAYHHALEHGPTLEHIQEIDAAARSGDVEKVRELHAKIHADFDAHHSHTIDKLKKAGATDKEIDRVEKELAKAKRSSSKRFAVAEKAAEKLAKAKTAYDAAEADQHEEIPEEPDAPDEITVENAPKGSLPEEPTYPGDWTGGPEPTSVYDLDQPYESDNPKPTIDDYEDDSDEAKAELADAVKEWDDGKSKYDADKKAFDEWHAKADPYDASVAAYEEAYEQWEASVDKTLEKLNAKVEKEHDKQHAAWERESERVEKRNEKRQDRLDKADGDLDEAGDAWESSMIGQSELEETEWAGVTAAVDEVTSDIISRHEEDGDELADEPS